MKVTLEFPEDDSSFSRGMDRAARAAAEFEALYRRRDRVSQSLGDELRKTREAYKAQRDEVRKVRADMDRISGRLQLIADAAAINTAERALRADIERARAKAQRVADAKARYDAEVRDILKED